jgi:hypothetical protein
MLRLSKISFQIAKARPGFSLQSPEWQIIFAAAPEANA